MKRAFLVFSLALLMVAGNFTPLPAQDSTLTKPKAKKSVKVAPVTPKIVAPKAVDSSKAPVTVTHKLVVYYFHSTQRCSNCMKFESYTKETIDSCFASQLKDSAIVWRLVNTDKDSNKHFRNDYELYTKSVVLSDLADGKQVRWKNLDKIWGFVGDKAAFQAYIREEVAAYLKVE